MPYIDTFRIWSIDNTISFQANFGDGAAIVTEGYAGWSVTARPKDVGVVDWQGRNPMAIEIPFLLDYYTEAAPGSGRDNPGADCENQVTNLEALCGIGSHAQPSVCYVDGYGRIPHDYTIYNKNQWVIEQVTWDRGQEIRSAYSGRRLKCGGTLTIRQYITASDILHRISPTQRATPPRTYKVKRGDNLTKIAAKFYGDANQWKKIADANKLRDPRSLKIGMTIKIP